MKHLLLALLLTASSAAFAQSADVADSTRRAELNASAGQRWAMQFRGATVNQAAERIHRYFVQALDAPQAMQIIMAGKSGSLVRFNLVQGDGTGRVLMFTFTTQPDARSHEYVVKRIKVEGEVESVLPFFIRFWDNRFATTSKSLTYRMGSETIAYSEQSGKAVITTN